jgi:hypothetical protein
MTSKIKVDNITNQSDCGATSINKCGTTITLGASGDTINLASQVHHRQVLVERGQLIGTLLQRQQLLLQLVAMVIL